MYVCVSDCFHFHCRVECCDAIGSVHERWSHLPLHLQWNPTLTNCWWLSYRSTSIYIQYMLALYEVLQQAIFLNKQINLHACIACWPPSSSGTETMISVSLTFLKRSHEGARISLGIFYNSFKYYVSRYIYMPRYDLHSWLSYQNPLFIIYSTATHPKTTTKSNTVISIPSWALPNTMLWS